MATVSTTISPNRTDALSALRTFLLAVLPAGVDVVIAIENRVPQIAAPNSCVLSPIRFQRIRTNVTGYQDVAFTASIAPAGASFTGAISPTPTAPGAQPSGTLNVSAVASGVLLIGGALSGPKVMAGTTIISQVSGPAGGAGVYIVSKSQTAPSTSMTQDAGLMTVSDINPDLGLILVGAVVFGVDVIPGTTVTALGSGTGGVGTYAVSRAQTVASETMSTGYRQIEMDSRMTTQVDFHSIDGSSADMAQTVAATFRDQVAVSIFAAQPPPLNQVSPLYADDPRLMPFVNENQQYEWRWVVEAVMQINQTVSVPQQFMDFVGVELIDVDVVYPPG
jgi:hypothetical protein